MSTSAAFEGSPTAHPDNQSSRSCTSTCTESRTQAQAQTDMHGQIKAAQRPKNACKLGRIFRTSVAGHAGVEAAIAARRGCRSVWCRRHARRGGHAGGVPRAPRGCEARRWHSTIPWSARCSGCWCIAAVSRWRVWLLWDFCGCVSRQGWGAHTHARSARIVIGRAAIPIAAISTSCTQQSSCRHAQRKHAMGCSDQPKAGFSLEHVATAIQCFNAKSLCKSKRMLKVSMLQM